MILALLSESLGRVGVSGLQGLGASTCTLAKQAQNQATESVSTQAGMVSESV